MRIYYYNQQHTLYDWHKLLPSLVLITVCSIIFGFRVLTVEPAMRPHIAAPAGIKRLVRASSNERVGVDEIGLVQQTNRARTAARLPKLNQNQQLSQSAAAKCNDLVTHDYWSHIDQQGRDPWHFLTESGYNKTIAAENLAYGFSSSELTIRGWMASSSHRRVLLDSNFTDVGFAVCTSQNFMQNGPRTLIVQHLAAPSL